MKYLVGYSGFVGSNIAKNMKLDGLFNHLNIQEAFGKSPDLLIYAGVAADKFLANTNEQKDLESVMAAYENIVKISPKKLVLISSIDVNEKTFDVDENIVGNLDNMNAYGKNRLKLELKIRETFKDALIVRLPALFGQNLKKNFIFDILNPVPKMLNQKAYEEYSTDEIVKNSYTLQPNSFYALNISANKSKLEKSLAQFNFSALNFTDSRASFQFYNLNNLAKDISIALKNNLTLLNINSEPVTASEVSEFCLNKQFQNEMNKPVPNYNVKSIHYKIFNGMNGYLYSKNEVLTDLKNYIESSKLKLAISNLAFKTEDMDAMIVLIKKYGFKALEIAPTKVVEFPPYEKQEELTNWATTIKKNFDISVCSLQSIWFNIQEKMFGENSNLEFLTNYTKKCIDTASKIGATNIVFGNPKSRCIANNNDIDIAKKFFVNLNDYAKTKGVTISIEPNPTIYGTNFLTTTKDAFEFVKALNCSNIKVNLDFGTILQNNENYDIIKNNINLIGHIHISEPYLELIKPNKKHKELISLLKTFGYKNYVSIEMKEQSLTDIENTMKYLSQILTKEK